MGRLKRGGFRDRLAHLTGCPAGSIFREVQRLTSFTEDITRAGMHPGAKTLRQRVIRKGPLARWLGRSSLLELKRLRYADGVPVCIEVTFLPVKYRRLVEGADLGGSLYRILRATGEELARSRELLAVRSPSPEERRLLGLGRGVPVIQIARVAYDRGGTPVEFTRNVLRADRYLFYFELSSR